jgi:ubiquinone/menaquinone biosynthesis C-methylase UbiE
VARELAVEAFDKRAGTYEQGAAARWHAKIVERAADVALAAVPVPLTILDVGCGTGALLREMIVRVPYGESYVGVDPAPNMIAVARRMSDSRITFVQAAAESLPFGDASFDLVVSTTSFDHWPDQQAGVDELARVVRDSGHVVLIDLSAAWLPQKRRARRPGKVRRMLDRAGLQLEQRETLYRAGFVLPLVRAFVASYVDS